MTDLARYLFFVGSYRFGPGLSSPSRAAVAVAPLFFVQGRYTGFPAYVSPTMLLGRTVGAWNAHRGVPLRQNVSNATSAIRTLVDHGILLPEERQGALRIARVYRLGRIEDWAWGPDELGSVERDWEIVGGSGDPWAGGELIAHELAPLVESHPEVSWTPTDPKMVHFVKVGVELANRFGLDTFRQAVLAAMEDPDAVVPFDALRFRDAFYGLVRRTRRVHGVAA